MNSFRLFAASLLAVICSCAVPALRAVEDERPVVDEKTVPTEKAAANKLPTLFIVGDSTLRSNDPMRGWGQELGAFFDPAKINVVNRAIGGRSSRTFQNEGRWNTVLAELKAGDFVLVQFGHNDAGQYDNPAAKGRPSLHGSGEETALVTKADGSTETVHTFGWYLRKYATDAKAKGATPILCSMVPHKDWKNGKIQRGERDGLVKWTEEAARVAGVPYLDLNEIIARGFEKLGEAEVATFFADQRTHSTPAGAKYNAAAVVSALKALRPNPLAKFFSADGEKVPPAQL